MKINKVFVLFLLTLLAVSCKEKSAESDNIFKFRDYVSYTTSGRVSVVEPIKIFLAKEVAAWEMGQDLDDDLIKIKPYVQGKLQAVNKTTLIFTPDETLQSDTEYSVTVKLGEFIEKIPNEFKSYKFSFKTITPSFSIKTGNLQSYSKDWQYITAQLRSADVIGLDAAKKLVSASQNDKTLSVVWNEDNSISKYYDFKIDSIQRFVEDSKVSVKWDGSPIDADNEGENFITIPGKNNFTIVDMEVYQ